MIVDYRCALSGVSLLGAEAMAVLLARPQLEKGPFFSVALPIFGQYDGSLALGDVHEGPNSAAILRAFTQDWAKGRAVVDFEALGVEPFAIDHIETLLSLIRLNQVHASNALFWHGLELDFALFESNVAAAAMQDEPEALLDVASDELVWAVLGRHPLTSSIYLQALSGGPRLRCKYGLSAVALASLALRLRSENLPWSGPGAGYPSEARQPLVWLTEATERWGQDAALVEALEEYASQLSEEDPPMDDL